MGNMTAISTRTVLFVFPTHWDARQLEICREAWADRFRIVYGTPDDMDCPWDLDVVDSIERTVTEYGGRIDGVTSSSDYPGATVAGAVATRLGLPGSRPETVMSCSHKYYSRMGQRDTVPEAVPEFHLVDPSQPGGGAPGLRFPCFIKPVKGAFSVMSERLENREALDAFLARPSVREFMTEYVDIFNRLVATHTDFTVNGSFFLAEGLLHGAQATVEGFCQEGTVTILGVVDSVLHPTTRSFLGFDYPSRLPETVQTRMGDIAARAVAGMGLTDSMFNVEMIHDPDTGNIGIVEINPRLCGQFADLYQKVDGRNGYEAALALATGEPVPMPHREGPCGAASSIPLRVFQPVRAVAVPDAARVHDVERAFPGSRVWVEIEAGQVLDDFQSLEDGKSYRYAVLNLGGANPEDLLTRRAEAEERLGFVFEPI